MAEEKLLGGTTKGATRLYVLQSPTGTTITEIVSSDRQLLKNHTYSFFFSFKVENPAFIVTDEIREKTSFIDVGIKIAGGGYIKTGSYIYLNNKELNTATLLRNISTSSNVISKHRGGNITGSIAKIRFEIDTPTERGHINPNLISCSFMVNTVTGSPYINNSVFKDCYVSFYEKDGNLLYTCSPSGFKESSPYVLHNGVWTPATVNRFDGTQWKDA